MKKLICYFTLCLSALCANETAVEQNSSLSSTNATYDGNRLVLTGHVSLDHGLGKMTAEEASLQRQEVGNDFPFSMIQLRKDVLLALKNSAQITCHSADLDFTTLKGILLSEENDRVVYTDQIKKKRGSGSTPLSLSGQKIELTFSKENAEGKKTEYGVDHILAKENVLIDYADNFHLEAHQALYRREVSRDNKTSKREFQGILTAYPKDEQSQCRLSHDGDEIFADTVDIDLLNAKISLVHAKGVLATSVVPHAEQTQTHFQSDYLYWDQHRNVLTLKGHISVKEDSLGTLETQEEVQMTMKTVGGKRLVKNIDTKGHSHLVYQDPHKQTHQLTSYGVVHLDRDQMKAIIDSPEKEGVVLPGKQIYYEESEIAFYADNALLEYSLEGDLMHPSLLTLKGNIRLFSHDPLKPPRFGSADRLTYSLTTRTLILSANPGKKVLFWDETQGMHLSAPEVHITYDPQTKEQSVKGIGAVQFSFTPEEQSRLQQLFPQLKTSS